MAGFGGSLDGSIGAYHDLADVLVNFRHILARALVKTHGDRWFEVACPEDVFERLTQRKDEEQSIDRYQPEYQQLLEFADFRDMAEIVFMIDEVAPLLRHLSSSSEFLCNRLEELEFLRRAIAIARPLSDDECLRVADLRQGFRRFLSGEVDEPPWDGGPQNQVEHRPQSADVAVDGAEDELSSGAEEPSPSAPAARPQENVPTFGVEEALRAGDNDGVLEALYCEVLASAETLLGEGEGNGLDCAVWRLASSWFAEHREHYELSDLETFYGLVAECRRRSEEGASPGELESFAATSGLPSILMRLRRLFVHSES